MRAVDNFFQNGQKQAVLGVKIAKKQPKKKL
jgi:hypothetical protein